MFKLGKILLTSGDDGLVNAIADTFLNLQAQIVEIHDLLSEQLDESTWLFVDWLLPAMAGVQLVRLLRQSEGGRRANIVMVLPGPEDAIRNRALEAQADDYIIGPLTPRNLIERMRIYQGATLKPVRPAVSVGRLRVDSSSFSARYNDALIPLKGLEFQLLEHFVRHPNRVFSRGDLIGVLGKSREVADERTVDVWMSRLRRTLQRYKVPHIPRTVRSFGYIFDVAEGAAD